MKFSSRDVAIRSALSAIGESQISPSELIAFVDRSGHDLACVVERGPHVWGFDFAKLCELRELVNAFRKGDTRDERPHNAPLELEAFEFTADSTMLTADSEITI